MIASVHQQLLSQTSSASSALQQLKLRRSISWEETTFGLKSVQATFMVRLICRLKEMVLSIQRCQTHRQMWRRISVDAHLLRQRSLGLLQFIRVDLQLRTIGSRELFRVVLTQSLQLASQRLVTLQLDCHSALRMNSLLKLVIQLVTVLLHLFSLFYTLCLLLLLHLQQATLDKTS